jgi:flagellin
VVNTTQFNGLILMNGTFNGSTPGGAQNPLTLQVGSNSNTVLAAQGNTPISYSISVTMRVLTSGAAANASYNALGQTVTPVGGGAAAYRTISQVAWQGTASAAAAAALLTPDQANADLAVIDGAIDAVSSFRGELGAKFNSMEHTIASLNVGSENQAAAQSRIRDLDVANQTVEFTKLQILQQAGTAVLAQANVAPQSVLQLLR